MYFNIVQANSNSASDQLFEELQKMQIFQADFVQLIQSETENKFLTRSSGKIWIKRPNLFRWESETPEHIVIVANGNRVWHYDESLEQVIVQTVSQVQSLPGLLLSGDITEIKAEFEVSQLPTKNQQKIFILKAKQQSDVYTNNIALYFSNGKLEKMTFTNMLNQHTEIKFNHQRLNINLNKKLFVFTVPKGVDVLGT